MVLSFQMKEIIRIHQFIIKHESTVFDKLFSRDFSYQDSWDFQTFLRISHKHMTAFLLMEGCALKCNSLGMVA